MAYDVKRSDLHDRVGVDGELTGLDKALIEMVSKNFSPQMMSDELGGVISAERCLARTKEILRSQNVYTIVEKQAVLLLDFVEVKNILFDRVRAEGGYKQDREDGPEYWVQGDPRWSSNLIKLLTQLDKMITASAQAVDANKGTLREGQRDLVFAAMERTFNHFLFELEQFLEDKVDRPALMDMMERAIPAGFEMIEAKTVSA